MTKFNFLQNDTLIKTKAYSMMDCTYIRNDISRMIKH
jgi:hypothetical protein